MKKDKLILLFSLIIIIGSGAVIYMFQGSGSMPPDHTGVSAEVSQQSAMLLNRISADKKRLESDPENFGILVNLGNSYYDLNNSTESITYYERALKIRPDSPPVLVDCGVMHRQIGNTAKALTMFKKAAELDPGLPQAFFNLGVIYYSEKNDPKKAAEIWQNFLNSNPGLSEEIKNFFEEKIQQARAAQ